MVRTAILIVSLTFCAFCAFAQTANTRIAISMPPTPQEIKSQMDQTGYHDFTINGWNVTFTMCREKDPHHNELPEWQAVASPAVLPKLTVSYVIVNVPVTDKGGKFHYERRITPSAAEMQMARRLATPQTKPSAPLPPTINHHKTATTPLVA
jgi:hypothetical protein